MKKRRSAHRQAAFCTSGVLLLTLSSVPALAGTNTVAADQTVDYATQVAPLLEKRCWSCHGAQKQESGLRLDRRQSLLQGGDSGGVAVAPGDSRQGSLVTRISSDDPDERMPPEGEPLSDSQIELIRHWIDQGAVMTDDQPQEGETLWSLRPLQDVRPVTLADPWVANPIDAFVLQRLKALRLSPTGPASPQTLARRAYLILHGVPPTFRQTVEWDQNFRHSVDAVLASPRYGERWAQHWLDVIRWAETAGFETNAARSRAWPYRDWLIRAFNSDKPYDHFVFAQLAGDTVGEDAALGFLVAGPANLPGQIGRDEESMRQARQDELDEVLRTVGQAFLGLTIGCARCHSHKFDPITQRDYYSLQAVFAGLRYGQRRLRGQLNDRWTAQLPATRQHVEKLRGQLRAEQARLSLLPPLTDLQAAKFDPVLAEAVRLQIDATADGGAASLYEVRAYRAGTDSDNVALARLGAKADASSFALENQTRHPDNLIDGTVDARQAFPWRAAETGPAWIQVDFEKPELVNRVEWQRGYSVPVNYTLAVRNSAGDWQVVADSSRHLPRTDDVRDAADVTLRDVAEEDVASLVQLIAKLRTAAAELSRLSAGPQVFAARFDTPDRTWLLQRGDPMRRLDEVAADVPGALGELDLALDAQEAERRKQIARFIVRPDNPLTARVIVNRIWHHYFGSGIVDTPSDFGRMGAVPTHSALLDWLARELIENEWSLKHIHRLILTSNTFRQASTPNPLAESIDAESRLLWRFPPRRLDAEVLRDSILAVSDNLNLQMFGPGFDFFNQKGGLSDYVSKETFDPDGWKRMIYATKIRMQTVDVFGSFDCPDAGQMTPKRGRSITPIQALNLLNSRFVNRQAKFLAARIAEHGGGSAEQVDLLFQVVLNRKPSATERTLMTDLSTAHGLQQACRVLLNTNEFVFLQ